MFGRFPIRDWVLLFICGWVIVHANWPTRVPVRTVTYRQVDGQTQQYTLDASDPQVAIIQERIKDWDREVAPIPLVIARWRLELADFYCRDAKPIDSQPETNVTQVAYQSNPSSPPMIDQEYWRIVRDKTAAWIEETECYLATSRNLRGESPLKLGPVHSGRVGVAGNLYSVLIGVMLASGICLWSLTNPAIELANPKEHVRRSNWEGKSAESHTAIKVEIPARWVRINQPHAVKIRRLAFAAIVVVTVVVQLNSIA